MLLHPRNRLIALSMLTLAFLMTTTLLVHAAGNRQDAGNGEAIFNAMCAACHSIGGGNRPTGPDLNGTTTRHELAWLTRWIKEPDKMLAEGDPIALQLLAEYNNVPMPNMGLSDAQVADVIAFLQSVDGASDSAEPESGEAAPIVDTGAESLSGTDLVLALKGDPDYGRKLFTGEASQLNGGMACIACHSVEGIGPLGGGALGPDLTHVYSRFGREGLVSMLDTLPFPTMRPIYADKPLDASEQAGLLAFFAQTSQQQGEPRAQENLLLIFGLGLGAMAIMLSAMLILYPRQHLSISEKLRKHGKL